MTEKLLARIVLAILSAALVIGILTNTLVAGIVFSILMVATPIVIAWWAIARSFDL